MKKISRQYKYQLKMMVLGRCIKCGKKAVSKYFCLKHMIYNREKKRNDYKRKTNVERKLIN